MSKEKELGHYKEIQKYLETQIKLNDISSIEEYVQSNIEKIVEIYYKFGSGNEYLRTPYNAVCFSNPHTALKYQELLETTVAGDVLFSDE